MTAPADKPRTTPEPGQPAADGNLGGMLSTADRGVADALQRSSERGDDSATGLAATGNASAGGQAPRSDLGGKNEPGSAPGATGPAGSAAAQAGVAEGRAQGADRAQQGSAASSGAAAGQAPLPGGDSAPPRDEGPLESFGRAISEVVTGTVDDRVAPLAPIAPGLPNTPNTRR